MNYDYWNTFYSKKTYKNTPSTFAELCMNYINPTDTLIDMGCGGGRDTVYFQKNSIDTISIDSSATAINNLRHRFDYNFLTMDIQSLPYTTFKKVDVVYCRFLLHAISEENENLLLNWAYNVLNSKGRIMIETRTEEDKKLEKHYDNHERRYINISNLRNKLNNLNFNILYEKEGVGLSPYIDENPYLVRFISEK
jgi:tellurite methyltransferase